MPNSTRSHTYPIYNNSSHIWNDPLHAKLCEFPPHHVLLRWVCCSFRMIASKTEATTRCLLSLCCQVPHAATSRSIPLLEIFFCVCPAIPGYAPFLGCVVIEPTGSCVSLTTSAPSRLSHSEIRNKTVRWRESLMRFFGDT